MHYTLHTVASFKWQKAEKNYINTINNKNNTIKFVISISYFVPYPQCKASIYTRSQKNKTSNSCP